LQKLLAFLFKSEDVKMEDENTQPATQPVVDPRCVGGNSLGLDDEEVADIICILHPTTPDAQVAVQLTKEHAPQHIITKPQFRVQRELDDDFERDISEPTEDDVAQHPPHNPTVYSTTDGQSNRVLGRDIALKFSSQANLPKPGFIFGRGKRSDVLIANHFEVKRVSNAHFRIFINSQGILMLEDMSTNGTFVDTYHLRRKIPNVNTQRMLVNSSIISVICGSGGNEVRFIVRIPVRTPAAEAAYKNKLNQYHLRFSNAGAKPGQGKVSIMSLNYTTLLRGTDKTLMSLSHTDS
jgi:pSer/pThr/pTyr-binding forkhead associated (FHA) protein